VAQSTTAQHVARAYVLNDQNRGIFERTRYFAERAGNGDQTAEAAVDFVLGGTFLRQAQEELDELARKWEPHLETEVRRVLDAGCGPGATTWAMAQRYPQADVVGVDVEAPALALARCLNAESGRCTFLDTPLEEFAPDAGFDIIQCREVLEHVFDPALAVRRLVSLLRPGGVAYLEMPNYLFPWEPHVKLPMLPRSPKSLLRAECRLAGRDPEFVGHLNFDCTRSNVRRWVRTADPEVRVVDLMAAKVDAIFASADRPKVARRAEVVDRVRRVPGAARAAAWAFRTMPIAPSVMVLVARPGRP